MIKIVNHNPGKGEQQQAFQAKVIKLHELKKHFAEYRNTIFCYSYVLDIFTTFV
jgi:hypothetical protein